MSEFFELIKPELLNIIVTIFGTIATFIGKKLLDKYNEIKNNQIKKDIVESVVNAVEQLYKDLSGTEKLEKAKISILEMLEEKGIKITDLELNVLIEAVVNGFNQGLKGE